MTTLSELNDVALERYRLIYRDGAWRIDISSLGKAMDRPRVRAALVVHPNNPTGNFVTQNEKKELNRLCAEKGCSLIADEVFFDFSREEKNNAESFASNREVLTFTMSGISKVLGLPQMKLSWIVVSGPEEDMRQALRRLEIIADSTLSVNTPAQTALPVWLERGPLAQKKVSFRIRENALILEKAVRESRCGEVLNAEGAWSAMVRFAGPQGDEEMSLRLLAEKNVLVHPGFFFDLREEDCLVLSLLPEKALFGEGVRRLCEALPKVIQ